MKKENVLVVALVVIALGAVLVFNSIKSPAPEKPSAPPSESEADSGGEAGIQWKDYTPGLATAREKEKNVFLYFHAPWCTYCTKLKLTTFQDEKVQDYLRENFVSIQVDTDQNRTLAGEWGVTGLPTLWFLDPQGNKITRIPGYVPADQFLQILRYIHTKSYTTMEFHEFVKQG